MALSPTNLSADEKAVLLQEVIQETVAAALKVASELAPRDTFKVTAPFVRYPRSSATNVNNMLVAEVRNALPESLELRGSAGPILYLTVLTSTAA